MGRGGMHSWCAAWVALGARRRAFLRRRWALLGRDGRRSWARRRACLGRGGGGTVVWDSGRVIAARGGGGSGGDDWSPSSIFREWSVKREFSLFLS